jgi:hypothetical protein
MIANQTSTSAFSERSQLLIGGQCSVVDPTAGEKSKAQKGNRQGLISLIGAVHEMETGKVRILE